MRSGLSGPVSFLRAFAVTFLTGLGLLTGFGMGGGSPLPWLGPGGPSEGEWYYALGELGGALEHDVLWHGIGPSMDHARDAEIVLVGSSLMGGIEWRTVQDYAARYKAKIYSLAVTWDYSPEFAESLMDKYGIRPKIVVLDGNLTAFTTGESEYARFVKSESYISRLKLVLSKNVRLRLIRLHHWIFGGPAPSILYRSASHGGRLSDYITIPSVRFAVQGTSSPDCVAAAKVVRSRAVAFAERMAARGARVVLTRIPQDNMCEDGAQYFAKAMGAEFIHLDWQGLQTTDHNHVVPAEMVGVTRQFMEGLVHSKTFIARNEPIQPSLRDVAWVVDLVDQEAESQKFEVDGMRGVERGSGDLPNFIRWATAPVVQLTVPNPPRRDLQLDLVFRPYFSPTRHFTINENGRDLASLTIEVDVWQQVKVRLPNTQGRPLSLQFRFDDADSDVAKRPLQLLFSTLKISPAE